MWSSQVDTKPMPTKLTSEIIAAAIEGFESQKRHIDGQIAELRQMLDGGPKLIATPELPRVSAGNSVLPLDGA